MGNIWVGPWANFPHYMEPTLPELRVTYSNKFHNNCQRYNWVIRSLSPCHFFFFFSFLFSLRKVNKDQIHTLHCKRRRGHYLPLSAFAYFQFILSFAYLTKFSLLNTLGHSLSPKRFFALFSVFVNNFAGD